ncbi:hypothetical protein Tco_0347816 [Tanacetum coccineum]
MRGGQGQISQIKLPHWLTNATWTQRSTRDDDFYSGSLTKLAQAVTSKDCQLGNPFVHILDPRAHIEDPMIDGMDGTD